MILETILKELCILVLIHDIFSLISYIFMMRDIFVYDDILRFIRHYN